MQIIKKIFNRIRLEIYYAQMYINCIVSFKIYENKVVVIGTPKHGNIGDHAILVSEEILLKENFSEYKIITLESSFFMKKLNMLKKIVDDNTLLLMQGGGYIGSLWVNEEEMFRKAITEFPNNKIIVFPQTIYFSDDEEGTKIYNESKKIYEENKNLTICCREEYSYKYMKENFPKVKTILTPDIVLYNDFKEFGYERKDALFCLREDKEKVNNSFVEIEEELKKHRLDIHYTDTVIKKNVYNQKYKAFNNKLKEFSKYKIVVTDRLHGMIFAYITKTPCIVFENTSYKIKGVYKWIKHCGFIKMYNEGKINELVKEVLNYKILEQKNDIIKEFTPLINEIQKELKSGGTND